MFKVPLLKFPLTALLIEDDRDFADVVYNLLKTGNGFNFETAQPESEKIKKLGGIDLATESLFVGDEIEAGVFTSEIHLDQLQKIKNKINELYPILICDYYLGSTDGLTLFEAIEDSVLQKILITGAAEEMLAFQAFNEGKIHGFLKKQIPNFDEHLKVEIIRNIERFFLNLSEKIAGSSLRGMQSLLETEDFKVFFNQFVDDNNIEEFYSLDGMGNFLLVSGDEKKIFHISSQEELQDVAESCDDSLKKLLQDCTHQIIRYERGVFSRPLEGAENYLVKTNKIVIKGGPYFYSVVPFQ